MGAIICDPVNDGGMSALIHVWVQQLSVKCLLMNGPVSLPCYSGGQGYGGRGKVELKGFLLLLIHNSYTKLWFYLFIYLFLSVQPLRYVSRKILVRQQT